MYTVGGLYWEWAGRARGYASILYVGFLGYHAAPLFSLFFFFAYLHIRGRSVGDVTATLSPHEAPGNDDARARHYPVGSPPPTTAANASDKRKYMRSKTRRMSEPHFLPRVRHARGAKVRTMRAPLHHAMWYLRLPHPRSHFASCCSPTPPLSRTLAATCPLGLYRAFSSPPPVPAAPPHHEREEFPTPPAPLPI